MGMYCSFHGEGGNNIGRLQRGGGTAAAGDFDAAGGEGVAGGGDCDGAAPGPAFGVETSAGVARRGAGECAAQWAPQVLQHQRSGDTSAA